MTGHLPLTLTAALAMATLAGGCSSRKLWVSKAAQGDGVQIQLSSYEYDADDINFLLRIKNATNDTLVVDLDRIRIVLPDGTEIARTGGKRYFTLWGNLSRYLRIEFESDDYDLREAPGVWMRVDGAFIGNTRLNISAMQIAQPEHQAGNPANVAVPNLALTEFAKGRERAGASLPVATGSTSAPTAGWAPAPAAPASASPPPRSQSMHPESANRQRIRKLHTKVAAVPLKAANVASAVTFIIDDLLLAELQAVGFEAIGQEDIDALLGFNQMQDQLACDDASCIAEIGNALGVDYITAGNIADIEGTTVVTLKLINVREATVMARVSKMADGGPRMLPQVISDAVLEMVQRSGL